MRRAGAPPSFLLGLFTAPGIPLQEGLLHSWLLTWHAFATVFPGCLNPSPSRIASNEDRPLGFKSKFPSPPQMGREFEGPIQLRACEASKAQGMSPDWQ